jgi:hypothetical protein
VRGELPTSFNAFTVIFCLIGGDEPSSAAVQLYGCTSSPSTMLSRSVSVTISQSKYRSHDSHTVPTETWSLARNGRPIAVQPASTAAVSVVAYSALATSTSVSAALARGAVPALQRANTALRFAAKCTSGTAGAADDSAMLSSLGDNPMQLSIATRSFSDQYDHAAGAVVGNTALLIVLGGVSHLVGRLRISARFDDCSVDGASRLGRLCSLRTLFAILPSSLLPGAVALPYTILMQPTVSGCVALLVGGAGRGSAALGAVLLALWVSVPMYFCWEILWRYRGLLRVEDSEEELDGSALSFPLHTRATRSVRGMIPSSTLFAWFMRPTEVWVRPRRSDDNAALLATLYERLEAVFEPYVGGREWFFLVEWGVGIISGAILGAAEVMSSSDDSALHCRAAELAAWSGIVMGGAQVLAYFILWPLQVRLELLTAAIVGGLAVGSQLLVLADASDNVVSSTILTASIVELLSVCLVMAREVFVEHKATLASINPSWASVSTPTNRAPSHRHYEPQVGLRLIVELVCTNQRRKHQRNKKEREVK